MVNYKNWLWKNKWLLIFGAVAGFLLFRFFQIPIMSIVQTQSVVNSGSVVGDPTVIGAAISAIGSIVAAVLGGKN